MSNPKKKKVIKRNRPKPQDLVVNNPEVNKKEEEVQDPEFWEEPKIEDKEDGIVLEMVPEEKSATVVTKDETGNVVTKIVDNTEKEPSLQPGDMVPIFGTEEPAKEEPKKMMDPSEMPPVGAGDTKCYCYYSMNVTKYTRKGEAISLGCVAPNGHTFYAEFTDFDIRDIDDYTFTNIIKNCTKPITVNEGSQWSISGNKAEVRSLFVAWLSKEFGKEKRLIQFISDKFTYVTFPILLEIITGTGDALTLPDSISPEVVSLNQDLGQTLYPVLEEGDSIEDALTNFVPARMGCTIDRYAYVSENIEGMENTSNDYHYAILDAYIIMNIHKFLWKF